MRIRFFNLCTLGGTVGATLATIAPLISGVYSPIGIVVCVLTLIFFFGLFFASQITKKYDRCIMAGVIGLNFVIYPALYFAMGGIDGGMVLYFIMGIIFSLLLLNLKESIIIFFFELIAYSLIFAIGYHFPEKFAAINITDKNTVIDIGFDFFIVSLTIAFIIKILYNAYESQAKRTDALLKELEELSITDPLTKVRNRRYLMQTLETEAKKSKRENYDISIVMFDIDKFKSVNDAYGHLIGDEVLREFAKILISNCREYDIVARYGGEEFIILLPRTTADVAFSRAETIRKTVESTELCSSTHIPITVSGGVAVYNSNDMHTVDEFIAEADNFLYEAKTTGRNKIVWLSNSNNEQGS